MTLFRAKGLEFDTVIIPGLARTPRGGDDTDLLHWRTREQGLLLASVEGARREARIRSTTTSSGLRATEADHELGRMLYVGVTRAQAAPASGRRSGRHGRCQRSRTWRTPRSASALAKLWKVLEDDRAAARRRANRRPTMRRHRAAASPLAVDLLAACIARVGHGAAGERRRDPSARPCSNGRARAPRRSARSPIACSPKWRGLHASASTTRAWTGSNARVRTDLIGEGVDAGALDAATRDVLDAIDAVRDDARGRWLFDATHADAASEWALAGTDDGAIVHVTLDRSFVADGMRWIVDFKTGRHEGGGGRGVPRRARSSATAASSSATRALCARSTRARSGSRSTTRWSKAAGASGRSSRRERKRSLF